MPNEDRYTANCTNDGNNTASSGNIAGQVCAILDDPNVVVTTYPDLFLALAQLRCRRIMEELESIREKDTADRMSENIKAIEENLTVMYSLYRRSLEYLAVRRIHI